MDSTKVLLSNSHHHHHHHGIGGVNHHHTAVGSSSSNNSVGIKRKSTSSSFSSPSSALTGSSTINNNNNNNNNILSNGISSGYSYMSSGHSSNSYTIPMVVSNSLSINSIMSSGGCAKCGGKKRHSKSCIFRRSDEDDAIVPSKDVIQRLDVAALKRYKKHYRLKTKHNSSKAELASIVRNHFDGLPVNEGEIIENFMVKVKKMI